MTEHLEATLAAYLLDELAPSERLAAERHLERCARCRAELDALRPTHELLRELAQSRPPDALWERIQARLPRARRRQAPRWLGAAAVAVAALALLWILPSGPASRLPLDPYLEALEASPTQPGELAEGFRALSNELVLAAAGMQGARRLAPSEQYSLWRGGSRRDAAGEVAQLIFRSDDQLFSIFLAPHATKFDFGTRATQRVRMGEWECTQVQSEQLAVYWSVSAERQSLLVAAADQPLDVARILSFFVYGRWDEES